LTILNTTVLALEARRNFGIKCMPIPIVRLVEVRVFRVVQVSKVEARFASVHARGVSKDLEQNEVILA
jgi:hypothetical protein